MKCNIVYVGKLRNGTPRYYCLTHKSSASDKKGNKLEECLCDNKKEYNNLIDLQKFEIKSIKIIYSNIFESIKPKILVNNKEFNGIFKYNNSILDYKDLVGTLLAKLNKIPLQKIKCSHCNHFHSDNGKFAYTPHKTHLCLYCGHLFRVKEKNVGNEFCLIFNIPNIKLNDSLIESKNLLRIEYDLLKGILLINNENTNKILVNDKIININEFLNATLSSVF